MNVDLVIPKGTYKDVTQADVIRILTEQRKLVEQEGKGNLGLSSRMIASSLNGNLRSVRGLIRYMVGKGLIQSYTKDRDGDARYYVPEEVKI